MAHLITWQDPVTGAVGAIRLDVVTSETPEDALEITDHPVEQGANVVDHAREQPTRLSIEGRVSTVPNPAIDTDTGLQTIEVPLASMRARDQQTIELHPPQPPITPSVGGLVRAGIGALKGAVPVKGTFAGEPQRVRTNIKIQGLQQNAPRNRVRDVYEALLRVQSSRVFVTVNTRDRDYFNVLIERVAKPRSVENGASAVFQIDFKGVRVAASKTVAAPKPAESRGNKTTNKGAQAAKTPPPEKGEKMLKSFAATLRDLAGGQ